MAFNPFATKPIDTEYRYVVKLFGKGGTDMEKATKGKTLYVSDLDGTLLNNSVEISDFSVKAINSLVEKGMIFSYATARSRYTSSRLTKSLITDTPAVIYNGTFVYDIKNEKRITEDL